MARSASLGTLTIDLIAQIAGFVAGMDQAARVAEERASRIEATFKNAFRAIEGAFGGFSVYKFVRQVVDATVEHEAALAKLQQTVAATGGAAGKTTEDLVALAKQLQQTTIYSEETALAAQNVMLGFSNVRGDIFDDAIKASANLAWKVGSLEGAARLLGRAFQDPVRGMTSLWRFGITLDASQAALIKKLQRSGDLVGAQRALYEGLNRAMAGAAETAANTLGGALTQLQNSFHDLFIAPGVLSDTTAAVKELRKTLEDPNFAKAAGEVTSTLVDLLTKILKMLADITKWENEQAAKKTPTGNFMDWMKGLIGLGSGTPAKPFSLSNLIENWEIDLRDTLFGKPGAGPGGTRGPSIFTASPQKAGSLDAAYAAMLEHEMGGGGGSIVPQNVLEQRDKMLEQLEKQADLYGKNTEAEKVLYETTFGDLQALEQKDKDRLLTAAKKIDQLKLETLIVTGLNKQYDDLLSGYTQAAVSARATGLDELYTKVEQLAMQQKAGALAGWDEDAINEAYLLAGLADKAEAAAREFRDLNDIWTEGAAVTEANLTPQERANEQYERLSDLFQTGAISMTTFIRASAAVGDTLEKAETKASKWNTFIEKAKANMVDLFSGAMTKWIDDFDATSNNILVHLARLLADMAAQIAAANLLNALFKPARMTEGATSTGFWGWVQKLFGSFVGSPKVPGPAMDAAGMPGGQAGGPMAAGGVYRVGEGGPELVVAPGGGYIIPHGASLGGGSGVTVNVINPPTTPQVTETRDANGQRQIQIVFEKLWQSSMADGKFDASLRGRYGLRPALGGAR